MRASRLARLVCAAVVAITTGCLQLLELDDAVVEARETPTAWAPPVLVVVDSGSDASSDAAEDAADADR